LRRAAAPFRARDNEGFPHRGGDVSAPLHVLRLQRDDPAGPLTPLQRAPGQPGLFTTGAAASYGVEHVKRSPGGPVDVPASGAHCLHCISGTATLRGADGRALGTLARGESALVPIGVGAYRVTGAEADTEVVKATPSAGA